MGNRTKLLSILSAAGIATGLASAQPADAAPFQAAVDQGTQEALEAFIQTNPDSALAPDALNIILAKVQHNNGTGKASDTGKEHNKNKGHGNGTYNG